MKLTSSFITLALTLALAATTDAYKGEKSTDNNGTKLRGRDLGSNSMKTTYTNAMGETIGKWCQTFRGDEVGCLAAYDALSDPSDDWCGCRYRSPACEAFAC
jgi:hypothetical protein